jgi:hypothetical protein
VWRRPTWITLPRRSRIWPNANGALSKAGWRG